MRKLPFSAILCSAIFCSAGLLLASASAGAQTFINAPCPDEGNNSSGSSWFFGHNERVCESRRTHLPLTALLSVAGTNGGIEVVGEDRHDIALEARVTAQASSLDNARTILREVQIRTDGTIEAKGPTLSGWFKGSWSVDYRLRVPRHLAANLRTQNGGIELSAVEGTIRADTTNGGLTLRDLGGDVHATTVNGGVDITLQGPRWQGSGLVARSTNGGVAVKAPNGYSAHLVASTVNGGISVDFPVTVQGEIKNHLDTSIGGGGPTLQFETVNGGVAVGRD